MLTRRSVSHTYGHVHGAPPPMHVHQHGHPRPAPTALAVQYGPGGGLQGGAVILETRGWVGSRVGNTGYGYLGMDPSDSSTWIVRPFNPTGGMISYLNFGAR